MPFEVAEKMFYNQHYKGPAMRGRQSVNPLNKLGFTIARERAGNIIITELGNRFISGNYDIGYIFFKSLSDYSDISEFHCFSKLKYSFSR